MKRQTKPADNKSELLEAVRMLVQEKGISEQALFNVIEDALKAAYKKNLGAKGETAPVNLSVSIDRKTGVPHVYVQKNIVQEVENPENQISLQDALAIKSSYRVGDLAEVDVTPSGFLRVAAQAAKQVIIQNLREAEKGRIYDENIERESEIVTAIVQRITDKGAVLELDRADGFLETSQMIPGETIQVDDHIKVYVLSVQRPGDARNMPQIRTSRIHENLVKRLFEMEVPEVSAGDVMIKSIAREAGSRTKMAVHSSDVLIDPVGACVGQRGGRVERVVEELKGEKIDIIKWSSDPAEFVANALNPAHVLSVYVADRMKACRVIVPDNQLSLAIGKEGQNARLAAKLTGWKIDIRSESQAAEMADMVDMPDDLELEMDMGDLSGDMGEDLYDTLPAAPLMDMDDDL